MQNSNTSQSVSLYVKTGPGRCSIVCNRYLLYEQLRKGHSFSSNVNYWLNPGPLDVQVVFAPSGTIFHLDQPHVELFLKAGASTTGLIVQVPAPTPPARVDVVKRADRSIERIEIDYHVEVTLPPFDDWVREPQPWVGLTALTALDGVFDQYRRIEAAFLAKDSAALLNLAKHKIAFASKRLQAAEEVVRARFVKDIEGVLQSPCEMERCIDPSVQLKAFPVMKGLVYKIEWASGMSAIHTRPDANGFQQGFQVYVALIQDKWVWVI